MGYEPAERHEHYDADGNLTGYTVVVREPEWDDAERAKKLAHDLYQSGIGPCGHHHSLTVDKANVFEARMGKCNVCAALDLKRRVLAERDAEEVKALKARRGIAEDKELPADIPRPSDGRSLWYHMLTPLEAEAATASQ